MSDKEKQNKYGTHRRISNTNIERMDAIGKFKESYNDIITRLLDFWEENHITEKRED